MSRRRSTRMAARSASRRSRRRGGLPHDGRAGPERVRSVERIGVEGTGAYGAGRAWSLRGEGVVVLSRSIVPTGRCVPEREVRCARRDRAARAASSVGRRGSGSGHDARCRSDPGVVVVRRSGRMSHQVLNQIRHLGFTAPDALRERLREVHRDHLARTAASLRATAGTETVIYATKLAIAMSGRQCPRARRRDRALDRELERLVRRTTPSLLDVYGVGGRSTTA